MNAALIEIVRDIPTEEIERVKQAGQYSRWTYFTDNEAGRAGVIYANDSALALYVPGNGSPLELGPLGIIDLSSVRYVPSQHQLNIERSGKYLALQVFSDPGQADHDKLTSQQWQQFLADHAVSKLAVTPASQTGSALSAKKLPAAIATIVLISVAVLLLTR